jgi:hypothetical protein
VRDRHGPGSHPRLFYTEGPYVICYICGEKKASDSELIVAIQHKDCRGTQMFNAIVNLAKIVAARPPQTLDELRVLDINAAELTMAVLGEWGG